MKIAFVYLGPIKYRGRMFKQIKTLQNAGHECLVIHGRTEEVEPDYSVYSFPVIPIRVIQEKNKLLTLITQLLFNRKAAKEILKSQANACVCIALQSALSGALAKKKRPFLKYIFDSNELSLEMLPSGLKRKIWSVTQRIVLKHADIIMHAEQHRLEYFNKTYPNLAKSFLLENLPYYRPLPKKQIRDYTKAVYLGILTPDRYCSEMLEAFSTFKEDIHFDLVGFFPAQKYKMVLEQTMQKIDATNIQILPPLTHNEIYDFLSQYDVGIAFYKNTNLNNYYCAPNKVYDYIQLGMPVITNDYPGLKKIIEENKIGVCLKEVTPENIRDAIRTIIKNNIPANITESIRKRYSWESQENEYKQLFN